MARARARGQAELVLNQIGGEIIPGDRVGRGEGRGEQHENERLQPPQRVQERPSRPAHQGYLDQRDGG